MFVPQQRIVSSLSINMLFRILSVTLLLFTFFQETQGSNHGLCYSVLHGRCAYSCGYNEKSAPSQMLCPSFQECCVSVPPNRERKSLNLLQIPRPRPLSSARECGKSGASYEQSNMVRVINGVDAMRCEFPWMVHLSSDCGGSVIDDRHILTAAHCFGGNKPSVIIGEYMKSEMRPNAKYRTRNYRYTIHEQYNAYTAENDIAIIILDEPIPMEAYECIAPICLPTANQRFNDQMCTVAGWGISSPYGSGNRPDWLMKTRLPIRSAGYDCGNAPNTLCVGFPDGRTDSCSGDSGGPLMCKQHGRYVLTGIVSSGPPKCDGVGTYVEVARYLDWINRHR